MLELIIYSFKYSAVKGFFRQNYKFLVPEFDYDMINSQEKTRLLQEAFMREFDKFTGIIDSIATTVDIDSIPNTLDANGTNYLNYLAQVIGYERGDRLLLSDASFRELLKNIIEIYRIKGTNYSFQLFFNLLGFDIIPQELWFDRRYGDAGIATNPFTFSTNKNSHTFYLTPGLDSNKVSRKPTDYIPSGMLIPYSITQDKISEPRDLHLFDTLTTAHEAGDSFGYSPLHLTGNVSINLYLNLLRQWMLNEGSGIVARDYSNNKRNLNLNATKWIAGGKDNTYQILIDDKNSPKFGASDSFINLGNQNQITLTFWASNKMTSDSCFAFSHGTFGTNGVFLLANQDGSGRLGINRVAGTESFYLPVGTFDSALRFYAFTFNHVTNHLRFYKNSIKLIDLTTSYDPIFANAYFYLGNYNGISGSTNWQGTFDEVRIYLRELSEYEVKEMYHPMGDTYTYFKTNSIQYSIVSLVGQSEANLTSDQINSINFYADFLTPIFVERNILFTATPTSESASAGWRLLDEDREGADTTYIRRPMSPVGERKYQILSIVAHAGDTTHSRGKVIVADPTGSLIANIHPTSDSIVGKYVLDRVLITGTAAKTNDGYFYIAGDTVPPKRGLDTNVTIYLKGDETNGIHGDTKAIPGGYLYIGAKESMFHRNVISRPSNFYGDTFNIAKNNADWVYADTTNPKSMRSIFYVANPGLKDEQIWDKIITLQHINGDTQFSSPPYGILSRDIFFFVDSTRNMRTGHYSGTTIAGDSSGRPTADSWIIYKRTSNTRSYSSGDSNVWWRQGGFITVVPKYGGDSIFGNKVTLSANNPLRTWDQRPNESYFQNYNSVSFKKTDTIWKETTGQIIYINANNGNNQAIVKVYDRNKRPYKGVGATADSSIRRFGRLTPDDYITFYNTKDERNRTTRRVISDSWSKADSNYSYIKVAPALSVSQSDSIGYIDVEQVRRIKKIVGNSGGFAYVTLFDGSGLFRGIKQGDSVQIISVGNGDSINGVYAADSVGWYRPYLATPGDTAYTVIKLNTPINHNSDSRGMVRLNSNFWTLEKPNFKFMGERFSAVVFRKA